MVEYRGSVLCRTVILGRFYLSTNNEETPMRKCTDCRGTFVPSIPVNCFKALVGNRGSSFVTNLSWMTQPGSKSGSFNWYKVFQQKHRGRNYAPIAPEVSRCSYWDWSNTVFFTEGGIFGRYSNWISIRAGREKIVWRETAPILQFLSLAYHRSPTLYGVEKQARSSKCAE